MSSAKSLLAAFLPPLVGTLLWSAGALLRAQGQTPAPDAELQRLFDQAGQASNGVDPREALKLYREIAGREAGDRGLRNRAAIQGAFLEWHVFQAPGAARALLARVPSGDSEASASWSERARLETRLARDFPAARAAAARALELAHTLGERETAVIRGAEAALEQVKAAQPAPRAAPTDEQAALLRSVADDLLAIIDAGGPVLESSRLLLDAALLAGDRELTLKAWRWYYAAVPALVPAPDALEDARGLGLALARARFFPEAEMVLLRSGAGEGAEDAEVRDVLLYAACLRRVAALAEDHHRAVAQGKADDAAFEAAFGAESQRLWSELSWPGSPPEFAPEAFQQEVERRFGSVGSFGRTDGVLTLLLGHKVIDESRVVEQHGRTAPLRFVALDGMVAGGYVAWVTGERTGTGGWIGSDAIYQIRPMYADGPVREWRALTDAKLRAGLDREIAAQGRLDVERARRAPLGPFPGLELRLERQASEARKAGLEARGLAGDALRRAFLEQAAQDEFETEIWAHEGRHAIDKSVFGITDSAELEFRAKTSEVALAPIPRGALGSILSPVGGPGAHGIANERLLTGVQAWMGEHAEEIAGLDAAAPLLPQLDRLTDDQLRAAFASLDPQTD